MGSVWRRLLVEFSVWKKTFVVFKMPILGILGALGVGQLPAEYNPKIHGPYDPAIYYGPKDKPFGQVKISELPGWLSRRGKTPLAMSRCFGRAYWRYLHKYCYPRKAGIAPFVHICFFLAVGSWILNHKKLREHKLWEHHW